MKAIETVVCPLFSQNRLTEVRDSSDDLIATYYYDPFGRRLWKEVYGGRTYFHYSDEGLVGEYDAGGGEIKTYGWRPGSTWGTDPVFMKVGSEYYFYHNDHLGTPQKMTAINGAVVWSAKYNAFGNASVDGSSDVVNSLRFPGQYFDDETGLHYNWHRYYAPSTGRYMTPDPIGLDGGINLYAYVLNDPVNFVDPDGLWALQVAGALIGGGANAYANHNAYQTGAMSGSDYFKSIVWGAGVGALSSFVPGIWGSAFAGGFGSTANDLFHQSITSECIDTDRLGKSFLTGFGVGALGGSLGKIGGEIIDPIRNNTRLIPHNHPYNSTGHGLSPATYGPLGGIAGSSVGTVATQKGWR
ncbi:MAG: RHS repeat-associated core domain-containing protein [Bacteroidota bacterium]|nr:RHS repeat-associated core domain-containing protein [Bacteroidota bacterium]